MNKKKDILAIVTMISMCATSICGILSMNFEYTHDFINQFMQMTVISRHRFLLALIFVSFLCWSRCFYIHIYNIRKGQIWFLR